MPRRPKTTLTKAQIKALETRLAEKRKYNKTYVARRKANGGKPLRDTNGTQASYSVDGMERVYAAIERAQDGGPRADLVIEMDAAGDLLTLLGSLPKASQNAVVNYVAARLTLQVDYGRPLLLTETPS